MWEHYTTVRGPLHGLEEDSFIERDGHERGFGAVGDVNSFEGADEDDAFVTDDGLDIVAVEVEQVCDDDED